MALKALTYWLGPEGFLPRNHTFRNRADPGLTSQSVIGYVFRLRFCWANLRNYISMEVG